MKGALPMRLLALAAALTGCGLQATTGPTWANERHPVALVFGGTLQSHRFNGPTFGGRVGMAVDDGLIPRQGFVHMGYDLRAIPGRLVIEPRLDLGLGGPIARAYSGVGAYLGGAASGRVRLWGVDDSKTEFNIIGSHLDLVLAARGGAWAPPEGSSSTRLDWEASVELGVRVAIISDVPSGPAGRVQAPVTPAAEEGGE